jgi:hypothetical protein
MTDWTFEGNIGGDGIREEMWIRQDIMLDRGEVLEYRDKDVHICADISCSGALRFENCVVFFGGEEDCSVINLKNRAELSARNCDFRSGGLIRSHPASNCGESGFFYFIDGCDDARVTITDSRISDAAFFIKLDCGGELKMERCEIKNPMSSFVDLYIPKSVRISDCLIKIEDNGGEKLISEWMASNQPHVGRKIFGSSSHHDDGKIRANVRQCRVLANEPSAEIILGEEITVFGLDNASFDECEFVLVPNAIYQPSLVEDCRFEGCLNAVKSDFRTDMGFDMRGCVLDGCTDAVSVQAKADSVISGCEFKDCTDAVIRAMSYGGRIDVERCRFENLSFSEERDGCLDRAFIRYDMGGSGRTSTIRDCVFSGVLAEDGYIIMADTFERIAGPIVEVEGCNFKFCTTSRDDEILIRRGASYYDFCGKERWIRGVSVGRDGCVGLEEPDDDEDYGCDGFLDKLTVGHVAGGAALGIAAFVLGKYLWDRRG